jgi:hypothetical protein
VLESRPLPREVPEAFQIRHRLHAEDLEADTPPVLRHIGNEPGLVHFSVVATDIDKQVYVSCAGGQTCSGLDA